jgi:hypothetical protein
MDVARRKSIEEGACMYVRCVVVGMVIMSCVEGTECWCSDAKADGNRWENICQWEFELDTDILVRDGKANPPAKDFSIHRSFAMNENGLQHVTGHENLKLRPPMSWLNEPFNLETTLADGTLTTVHLFNRSVQRRALANGGRLPPYIEHDALCFFVPVWPLKGYHMPAGPVESLPLVVSDALASELYSRSDQPTQEQGELCYSLRSRSGVDRIAIAIAKPLCVMRREIRHPATGHLAMTFVTRRIAEVASGLWMPVEVEHTTFAPSGEKDDPPVSARSVTRILRWKLSAKSSMLRFAPTMLPGTIEERGDGSFEQIKGGGREHLDVVASFVKDHWLRPADWTLGHVFGGGVIALLAAVAGVIIRRACARWPSRERRTL